MGVCRENFPARLFEDRQRDLVRGRRIIRQETGSEILLRQSPGSRRVAFSNVFADHAFEATHALEGCQTGLVTRLLTPFSFRLTVGL